METGDKKIEKNKSIMKILISGIIILSICLVACLIHVIDIRLSFSKEITEQFSHQLFSSKQLLNENIDSATMVAEDMAEQLGNLSQQHKSESIFNIIMSQNSIFDEVIYIRDDSLVYSSTGIISSRRDNEKWNTKNIKKNETISVRNVKINGMEKNYILIHNIVYKEQEEVGELLAYYDLSSVMSQNIYQYLSKDSDELLTDEYGNVISTTFQGESQDITVDSKEETESHNFYDYFINNMYDKSSWKVDFRKFQDKMRYTASDETQICLANGEMLQLQYQKIDNTSNLYLVCFYNLHRLEERINPTIFRSVLTCMLIIVLMISLIIYVWANTKNASKMIEKLAYTDNVTGEKNRNYFKERATEILYAYPETPFLMNQFDIVNFSYVNESYGHQRADELLKGCIVVARECFLENEICARMDADQFILLTKNDARIEFRRAEFVHKMNEYAQTIGIKYPIRLKFGIYQIRKNDIDIELMVDRANAARKSLNGDEKKLTAYYSDSLINEMRKIDKIESEMHKALGNEEFQVYLQPKWDIIEDRLVGMEALARWIRPDGTKIMPNEFIPIFENNGFIEKLDFYMLEKVCIGIREVLDKGYEPLPVSVNQSRLLLNNQDYVKKVARILKRYKIPEGLIELELTETVFMGDKVDMIRVMKELNQLRVLISMDDFGSGFSSLNLLKEIPFDILKIDREFFSESTTTESTCWILQKVIEMAHGLQIDVVCEGVETGHQVELLKELGCRYVQGYYFSAPLSKEDFFERYFGELKLL